MRPHHRVIRRRQGQRFRGGRPTQAREAARRDRPPPRHGARVRLGPWFAGRQARQGARRGAEGRLALHQRGGRVEDDLPGGIAHRPGQFAVESQRPNLSSAGRQGLSRCQSGHQRGQRSPRWHAPGTPARGGSLIATCMTPSRPGLWTNDRGNKGKRRAQRRISHPRDIARPGAGRTHTTCDRA